MRCDNCSRELNAVGRHMDMTFCIECYARIRAADAEREYWEARKRELG